MKKYKTAYNKRVNKALDKKRRDGLVKVADYGMMGAIYGAVE